ncbi:S9 family peptidase [Trebonia kvetii]|uniref:prolyl oligopeptidase n=1 Tax=Trebonia kvetii TaxID=2480626 RepID=A0A6P2BW25_9ACTN|nr:prolyl oligopeptidase family serine peptidase [Trebonia kvetii]TVZ01403.1 S9 family peptidase [Trebonia kvetii]
MASVRVQDPAAGYPEATRLDLVEDLFGHQVADPYRWLEDTESPQSQRWLGAEGELWAASRDGLPRTAEFTARVRELLRVGAVGLPAWRGGTRFYTRRDPDQEHAVLYVHDGTAPDDTGRVLVDPSVIDATGRTTLDAWSPDKEGRLLAYQLSHGGDEEALLRVMDVATGEVVDGPIDRCRYSGVAWLPGGKAFYYTRRLAPEAVPEGETQYHRRVYLHVVGTPPEADTLIFGEGRDKKTYFGVSVSRDGSWLLVSASVGTAPREDIWIASLTASDPAAPVLIPLMTGLDAMATPRVGRDGKLYVLTDLAAPRGRICVADPFTPGPESWVDLVPEDPSAVLRSFAILDEGLDRPVLVVSRTRHAVSEVTVHDLATGEQVSALALPGIGTVGGVAERPEGGHEAWFGYTDYTTPPVILRYDAATGAVDTWAASPGAADNPPAVTASQVTYYSADGTPVRMVIIEPAGVTGNRSGERSCILYGYGGFDISQTPGYSASILAWVEAGGVYAVAGLRGGSEEGEEWHRAGMLDRKQNVFDDFHAAAEYLIETGVTTPERLAVWGGSNGGLLVGAAVTQRPDLFTAAVCSAPLLDMVRYERFKIGETWNVEYGSAAKPEELAWLLGYSPYHRVRDGVAYPAVLFTVFTNDSRVDPMHAYKMCAALQHATSSGRPVLLRAEGQVGHSQRAVSLSAALSGDCLAFVARETGLPPT